MKIEVFGNELNPKVLVIGCFHGDEPQGEYLIRKYLEKKLKSSLLFVPRLNASNTRTNYNAVDLNRNFPTRNWILAEKNDYFGGEKPASEIETRFIISIVEKYNPKVILSLHAPYKVVNYDGPAEGLAKKISEIIGYPVEESIGYPTPGSFGTWAGVERQISTITLELDEEVDISSLEKPVFEIFEFLEGVN